MSLGPERFGLGPPSSPLGRAGGIEAPEAGPIPVRSVAVGDEAVLIRPQAPVGAEPRSARIAETRSRKGRASGSRGGRTLIGSPLRIAIISASNTRTSAKVSRTDRATLSCPPQIVTRLGMPMRPPVPLADLLRHIHA
jgi:hypothetical protein